MRPTILLALLAALTLSAIGQQKVVNNDREAFLKRVYLSTSDDPLAIIKVKTMTDFELQAPLAKKSRLKAGSETGSLVDSTYSYQWDAGMQDWAIESCSKTFFYYNSLSNLSKVVQVNWDNLQSVWLNFSKIEYSYNNDGLLISTLVCYWQQDIGSDSFLWTNSEMYTQTYDLQGEKTSYLVQYWDIETNNWINSWQHFFYYESNLLTETDEQVWSIDEASWVDNSRYNYNYNSSSQLENTTTLMWNLSILEWENNERVLNSYDNNGNNINTVSQSWQADSLQWINLNQRLYTYQGNQIVEYLSQTWNTTGNTWMDKFKGYYLYDTSENNIGIEEKQFDNGLFDWINNWMYAFNYDSIGRLTFKTELYWNKEIGNWNSGNKINYYYSEKVNTRIKYLDNTCEIYPNPFIDKLNIYLTNSYDNMEICDQYGRIIYKNNIDNSIGTNVIMLDRNTKSGIYFVLLIGNDIRVVKKIVKQ